MSHGIMISSACRTRTAVVITAGYTLRTTRAAALELTWQACGCGELKEASVAYANVVDRRRVGKAVRAFAIGSDDLIVSARLTVFCRNTGNSAVGFVRWAVGAGSRRSHRCLERASGTSSHAGARSGVTSVCKAVIFSIRSSRASAGVGRARGTGVARLCCAGLVLPALAGTACCC